MLCVCPQAMLTSEIKELCRVNWTSRYDCRHHKNFPTEKEKKSKNWFCYQQGWKRMPHQWTYFHFILISIQGKHGRKILCLLDINSKWTYAPHSATSSLSSDFLNNLELRKKNAFNPTMVTFQFCAIMPEHSKRIKKIIGFKFSHI